MPNVVSRGKLLTACIEAINEAQKRYSEWTPNGVTMRHAPESFVQSVVAEKISGLEVKLLLEALVSDLVPDKSMELPRNDRGRLDIAVYYKSKSPRILIETKKITESQSFNNDYNRIREMLEICPSVTNGLMIGYTTAINAATVDKRLDKVKELTGARIVRRLTPQAVRGKKGGDGFLGAAIYRVDREKS